MTAARQLLDVRKGIGHLTKNMYLHLTLLATILFGAVFLPSLAVPNANRTLNQLADSQRVVSTRVEDETAPPCELKEVFCDSKRLMRITEYGVTGNLTASGKVPRVGMVATSDRSIPFGSKVEIEGKTYSVEDRTAKWVHGLDDTIDIFSENPRGLSYRVVYFK